MNTTMSAIVPSGSSDLTLCLVPSLLIDVFIYSSPVLLGFIIHNPVFRSRYAFRTVDFCNRIRNMFSSLSYSTFELYIYFVIWIFI